MQTARMQVPPVHLEGLDEGDGECSGKVWGDKPMITVKDIQRIETEALAEGQRISQVVGDNWYPCGFAHIRVDGKSPLVSLFKKNGRPTGYDRDGYQLGYFRAFKDSYAGGYWMCFDYPAKNATESQSLNFQTPLYHFIQRKLAELDIRASVETRVD